MNNKIQRTKCRARGFRNSNNLINVILLPSWKTKS
ncbi:MAG: transposase [Methylococcales symbiont of Iophon sp. n. MRB-2018]|nr:MAG: transposase [Methylococcales symbiont of Iophon sp. n. MRB-2018]KAF3980048.1 MAG: transposase [Methylococcales symbiont of Iophon sp. n. MRB-2018]